MSHFIFAHKGSKTAFGDLNSCAVIALEHAFPLSKGEATEYCSLYGRKRNCGMYADSFHNMVSYLGAKLIGVFGSTRAAAGLRHRVKSCESFKGMSIKTMMEYQKFKTGTYIVYVTGHFTVVKDGVLYDPNSYLRGGTSVIAIWEV